MDENLKGLDFTGMNIEDIKKLIEAQGENKNNSNNVVTIQAAVVEEVQETPLRVTSLHELEEYAKGKVTRFPDFAEGQPFVARVKRPSMLVLAKQGKIPNTLMFTANELFANGEKSLDTDNEKMLEDMLEVMETICEASLIEPSLQDIKDKGIQLSDDQMTAIFNYTQGGVKALETFRKE